MPSDEPNRIKPASTKALISFINGAFVLYDYTTTSPPRLAHTPDQLSAMVFNWAKQQMKSTN